MGDLDVAGYGSLVAALPLVARGLRVLSRGCRARSTC